MSALDMSPYVVSKMIYMITFAVVCASSVCVKAILRISPESDGLWFLGVPTSLNADL